MPTGTAEYQQTSVDPSVYVRPDQQESQNLRDKILLVFSDLDGTLIHYPKEVVPNEKNIQLPASSTGLVGVVSKRTFQLCQQVRQRVPLYFVSGMRFTTLLARLPYLPRADAYCCDGGGRVFWASDTSGTLRIEPRLDGEAPFYLSEDSVWRKHVMEQHTGRDGFVGSELQTDATSPVVVPIRDRDGPLWRYAKSLLDRGLILDTRGYATCFRVNRKHQSDPSLFDSLLTEDVPQNLAKSTNLGCVDVYPIVSGKLNWYVPFSKDDVDFRLTTLLLKHQAVITLHDAT